VNKAANIAALIFHSLPTAILAKWLPRAGLTLLGMKDIYFNLDRRIVYTHSMEKIIVTGTTGLLGSTVVAKALEKGGFEIHTLSTSSASKNLFPHSRYPSVCNYPHIAFDDYGVISSLVDTIRPKFILHCAALSSTLLCEQNPKLAWSANAEFCATLARVAQNLGVHLIGVSTDLVFEGTEPRYAPFAEDAPPCPISVYAQSKRVGEEHILSLGESGSVARVSLLLGHTVSPSKGHLGWLEDSLSRRTEIKLFTDETRTPIWTEDAARFLLEIGSNSLSGLYHLGTEERLSRAELGDILAVSLGYDRNLIQRVLRSEMPGPVYRAEDVSLNCNKFLKATGLLATSIREVFSGEYRNLPVPKA
jgi:dTDP-4-dehydrorhamnose reductase